MLGREVHAAAAVAAPGAPPLSYPLAACAFQRFPAQLGGCLAGSCAATARSQAAANDERGVSIG